MSGLDDIESAATALAAYTVTKQGEAAAIQAQVAAALAALVAQDRVVYLDAVAGLDTNDGTLPTKAVQTVQGALARVSAGQRGIVTLLSDVTVSSFLAIEARIVFQNVGGVSGTRRKMTFAPGAVAAVSQAAGSGSSYAAIFDGDRLEFSCVDLAVGAITTAAAVILVTGKVSLTYSNITFDPAATAPLFAAAADPDVQFNGVGLPSGYGGKLFAGVAAGANPNSLSLRTNVTAA